MPVYARDVNQDEIELLGDNWEIALDKLISDHLKKLKSPQHSNTTMYRVLMIVSSTPLTFGAIFNTYELIYGRGSASREYIRLVIHKLYKAGKLDRPSRGEYVKRT